MEHQLKGTSVFRTVYLDDVAVRESRSVHIPVLLVIINLAMQHGCQSRVV